MLCRNSLFPVLVTLCLSPAFSVQLHLVYVNASSCLPSPNIYRMLLTGQALCRI